MPLRSFKSDYWEQRPVYVRGMRERVECYSFGVATMFEVLARIRRNISLPGVIVKAQGVDQHGAHSEFEIDGATARDTFAAGFTVCASGLDRFHEPFAKVSASAKWEVGFCGKVSHSCYYSPVGGGFGLHLDNHAVIIIQLEGSKKWWYSSEPSLEWPPRNMLASPAEIARLATDYPSLRVRSPLDMSMKEVNLEPGDILYLPAGTWHRTQAIEASLALTMAWHHVSAADFFLRALRKRLESASAWRRPVRADFDGNIVDLIQLVRSDSQCQAFGTLASSDLSDSELALQLLALLCPLDARNASPAGPIGGRYCFRPDTKCFIVDKCLFVAAATKTVQLSGDALPLIKRMMGESSFRLEEIVVWDEGLAFDREPLQDLFSLLTSAGLLVSLG